MPQAGSSLWGGRPGARRSLGLGVFPSSGETVLYSRHAGTFPAPLQRAHHMGLTSPAGASVLQGESGVPPAARGGVCSPLPHLGCGRGHCQGRAEQATHAALPGRLRFLGGGAPPVSPPRLKSSQATPGGRRCSDHSLRAPPRGGGRVLHTVGIFTWDGQLTSAFSNIEPKIGRKGNK